MEYLQGHTLKDHIKTHGVLTPAQALFIANNVSNALMAAHSANVLHRDISPDNIILCDNGNVTLIDFGAARQVVAEHSQSFSVILKPGFAPLEQYQKKGNQGPWTDIYSLGTTIYHALTGDIPEDPMSRIDDDEEFSSNAYNIEPELWAVIQKDTQLRVEDRYPDIFVLRNDLSHISYQPEPVIVPTEDASKKMPQFQTAVPFGMTQTAAAVNPQPAANIQPVASGAAQPAPAQQKPLNSGNFFKKHGKIVAAIAAALVLIIGAAIIIPNVIKSNNGPSVVDSDDKPSRTSRDDEDSENSTASSPEEEVKALNTLAAQIKDATAGSILSNRYVIGRVIGKGGFGTTYLAYDALVCRKIAIKEYFPYGIAQRTSENADVSVLSEDNAQAFELGAEKFYNESKLVSRFNGNPNIVGVFDCFYENNTVYMAMEYLSGRTLKEYIREHGVLSVAQALYVAKIVTGALVVAHSASILHRDISPDNIIVCDDGNIKLIDFGAARQVVAEHSQSFSVILKPGFAPPEQYSKKGNQGAWTDVYSVGTTLYYMLTGDIPEDPSARFDHDDTFRENNFNVDPALWEVITKATKLKAEDRYRDAYELKRALDLIPVADEPLIVQDETQSESGELPSMAKETRSQLSVSIKKPKPKQSFWRKHRRTIIEAVCGLLVVALVVPLALKAYKPAISGTTSDTSQPTNDRVAAIGSKPTLEDINYSGPLYDGLDKEDKQLYSDIYYGLIKDETQIIVDTLTYTIDDVDYVYSCVLNENPILVHTRGYNVNYNDLNNNKEPDPDEYVNSISPIYSGIDREEYNNFIYNYMKEKLHPIRFGEKFPNGEIEALKFFFDDIALNTYVLGGFNTRPSASTAYGAVIDRYADRLGIARAICDVAQRLGFDSYVFEGYEPDGDKIAWCCVKMDDI